MEIAQGIHKVDGVFWSNVYLIEDDDLAIVDCGPAGSTGKVVSYIRELGRRPEDVRYIFITHAHPDHAGGAPSLKRLTGAQVLAHAGDTRKHKDGATTLSYMRVFGSLPIPVPFLKRIEVDHLIQDDEVIPIRSGIRVLHTPGHTPGSACFLLQREGVVFTGDTVLSDGKALFPSMLFPSSNAVDYGMSLDRLSRLALEVACGGHGRPLDDGVAQELAKMMLRYPNSGLWDRIRTRTAIPRLRRYLAGLYRNGRHRS